MQNITTLNEQCEIIKGKKPENITENSSDLPYLLIDSFNGKITKFTDDREVPQCEPEDILIVMDGASSGLVATGLRGAIGSTMASIKIKNKKFLLNKYMFFYLKSKYQLLNSRTSGSAIPHIDKVLLKSLPLQIPSIQKQKKIISILEKAQELVQKQEHVKQITNHLIQSIFMKMFDNTLKSNEQVIPLGELVIEKPQNGLFKKNNCYGKGTKIVWVEHITNYCVLDESNLKRVKLTKDEILKYCVEQNDVLVTRSSHLGKEGVGVMNVIKNCSEDIVFESHLMKLKFNIDKINPIYLCGYFNTKYGRSLIEQRATQATMSTINQPSLLGIKIHLPSIKQQNYFEKLVLQIYQLHKKQPLSKQYISDLNDSLLVKI